MSVIKVAIIGSGAIARAHIEAYQSFANRCEVVALCDIYLEKAQSYCQRYGIRKAVSSFDQLLDEKDIDLVSICTPPYTHKDIAVSFLNAGKHVLVEKPMAASLQECDEMIEAARSSERVLSVVAQNRFRTDMMKLKHVLDSGLAGRILHAQVDSYWWRGQAYYDLWWRGTWEREGGGCTLNHAVHHLDALQWMMGMPSEVSAMISNVAHDNAEVEDLSMALFRFPNGAVGQATSSVVHHGEQQQIILQGQYARIAAPWQLYASRGKDNGFPERDMAKEQALQAFYDDLPDVALQYHKGQINDVLTAIETGSQVLVDGLQGRNTLEVITAIYKSANTFERVTLPLAVSDDYYRRESFLHAIIHFHEKSRSIENFATGDMLRNGHA